MARINADGYVERKTRGESIYRDWWFIKVRESRDLCGFAAMQVGLKICFPSQYIGKKIRLKVEVLEDEERKEEVG